MIIRFNPRWLLVSALLFSFQICRAQVDVPPTISFDLGSSNAPDTQLWDLSGNYRLDLLVEEHGGAIEEPMRLSFILNQDGSGRLSSPTNDNTEEMEFGDNSVFTVFPRVTGKVTGSGGTARVHFSIRITGSGNLAGQNVNSFSAMLTVDAETDPTTGLLTGTKLSKFSAHFPGLTINGPMQFSTPMPQGANAMWNLSLQLAGLNKLTGTGVITTPSRPIGLNLSGAFKKGIFKIKAKGANNVPNALNGAGSSATIQLPDTFDSILLNGKLLGQKLSFSFPED